MLPDQRQARRPPPGFENVIPRQLKYHDANKDPSSPSKPRHQHHILLPPHLQPGNAAAPFQSNAATTFPPNPTSAACLPVTVLTAIGTCSSRGIGQAFAISNSDAVATSTGGASTGAGLSDLLAKHRAAAAQRISRETGLHPQPAHFPISLQHTTASAQPSLNMPPVAQTGMQHLHTISELPLGGQATKPAAVPAPRPVQAFVTAAEPCSAWQVGPIPMPHQSSTHPLPHHLPYPRPGPAPGPRMGPDLAPHGSGAPPAPATGPWVGQVPPRGTAAHPDPYVSKTSVGGGGGVGYAADGYGGRPNPADAGWTPMVVPTTLPPPMSRAAAAAGPLAPAESTQAGAHQTVRRAVAAHHIHAGALHTQLAASAASQPSLPGEYQTAAAAPAFPEHVQEAAKPCHPQHPPGQHPTAYSHWSQHSHAHAEVKPKIFKPSEPVMELAAQRRYLFASTPVCFQCGHAGHEGTECDTEYCDTCDLFGHVSGECRYACSHCGGQHDPPLGHNCNQPRCSTCRLWGHTGDDCPLQQCRHCQWYGHTDQDCPGYCRYCHEPGHQTDDCPVYRCSLCRNQGHKWQNCPLHLQEKSPHTFQLPWHVQAGVQQDVWADQQQQEQQCSDHDTDDDRQMADTFCSSKPWRDSDRAAECKGKGTAPRKIGLSRFA